MMFKKFLDFFPPKIDEYEELLTANRIWVERTKTSAKSRPRTPSRWA